MDDQTRKKYTDYVKKCIWFSEKKRSVHPVKFDELCLMNLQECVERENYMIQPTTPENVWETDLKFIDMCNNAKEISAERRGLLEYIFNLPKEHVSKEKQDWVDDDELKKDHYYRKIYRPDYYKKLFGKTTT